MALTAAIFYPLAAIIVASGLRGYCSAQDAIAGVPSPEDRATDRQAVLVAAPESL